MRTAAAMSFFLGVILMIDSGMYLVRSKVLARRSSERWGTYSAGFRKGAHQLFFGGVFLELLGCVLFVLSFV